MVTKYSNEPDMMVSHGMSEEPDMMGGSKYGHRADGTYKGDGYFGEVPLDDGTGFMTELSIGVNIDDKETEIPLLVPTLTDEEIGLLKAGKAPSRDMIDKAVDHARSRLSSGKSPFKGPDDVAELRAGDRKKKITPLAAITKHEGFRLDPYKDTKGYLTGGTGHKMSAQDIREFDTSWSDEEKSNYWASKFENDFNSASTSAIRIMNEHGIEDNTGVKNVLTNMVFNMGESGVKKFKNFLKAVSNGDVDKAIYEMKHNSKGGKSGWYKDVGKRVDDLADEIRESLNV